MYISVTPILYLFAVAVVGQALTPSTFLTTIDQDRLKKVFKSSTPYTDLPAVHYSILGLKLLGDTSINNQVSAKNKLMKFYFLGERERCFIKISWCRMNWFEYFVNYFVGRKYAAPLQNWLITKVLHLCTTHQLQRKVWATARWGWNTLLQGLLMN